MWYVGIHTHTHTHTHTHIYIYIIGCNILKVTLTSSIVNFLKGQNLGTVP